MSDAYFNRELSLLEFNKRVLHQAYNQNLPLLERLRFLCIFSTNLDEFFEVRVGGLLEVLERNAPPTTGPDGLALKETLDEISIRAHQLVHEQYQILNRELIPLLATEGIRVLRREEWSEAQVAYLQHYFHSDVLPVLSPIGLDPAHPFPRILNKSLNFIVRLDGKDAFGRNSGRAIVQVPRSLTHLVELPSALVEGGRAFVFISSIIHYFMAEIFVGMTVMECYQFRLTRNSDIFLDEEETEDLLRAVQGELVYRQYGDEVRLELTDTCPAELEQFLLERCEIKPRDLYRINGPVNLNRYSDLFELIKDARFYFKPFVQSMPKLPKRSSSYFDAIQRQDILLHHPFDSFQCVVDFLREAAADPQVLAIKQTLYRTGSNSPIVDALVAAAKAGKEVTAIVELRARFDEEQNVALAERLQRYGIHVIYGVVGFKTHAKMILVARREAEKLRYYVHLGTGNYHPRTSKIYTDYGLLTCDKEIGEDVYRIFLQLSSMGKASKMDALLYAPFTLHKGMVKRIRTERENAEQGKPARIIAKMNALYDLELVNELYAASQAGVQIDLIVRGVCQLLPGMAGLSENIRVRSIIGRFLEHHRVFYFENGGNPELFCSSADWMLRNMFHRVETCFPIRHKKIRERIMEDLELYLRDNTHAWLLQPDGAYVLARPGTDEEPVDAQATLLERWAAHN
ncbi:polyphosphate kinase 1 [Cellvibrio japonicus]|uniref:polyphosphate kinase 1 n=1 Tax=Cellvibrio japonicus TaxID=155077 RepID=UPI00031CC326|nr:polyphosphate kinase 1 [Cellvibrio japonicus]QEI13771.1 polyphosphate kinase 1 [Cellvibrio japonicus]QEI17345.1 polyphosphate kinase 1 [Cellvibrio japonicus]QEI20921.1 polyphosphate kinase 1 [Cellvibrio japonicus]